MTPFWAFFIGLLLGMISGFFVAALLVTAKQSDEQATKQPTHFDERV